MEMNAVGVGAHGAELHSMLLVHFLPIFQWNWNNKMKIREDEMGDSIKS